jgi:hypothetical protein
VFSNPSAKTPSAKLSEREPGRRWQLRPARFFLDDSLYIFPPSGDAERFDDMRVKQLVFVLPCLGAFFARGQQAAVPELRSGEHAAFLAIACTWVGLLAKK